MTSRPVRWSAPASGDVWSCFPQGIHHRTCSSGRSGLPGSGSGSGLSTRRPYNSLYVYGLATNEKTRRSRLGRVSFRNVSNSGESEERMLGCSLRFTAAGKRREEFLSSRIYIKPSGGVPAARRDCVSSQTVNLWCSSDRARATHVAVWYG